MKLNSTVCVIGSRASEFCKEFGKKGGESDYRLWHSIVHEKIITACEPFRWPEKLAPLMYCLNLSDFVVVAHDTADAALGEALVALDLLDKKEGCFATEYGIEQYAKGTVAEAYEVKANDEALEWARTRELKAHEGDLKVLIDSSFAVKGLGNVLLGFVERGTVRVHDKLVANPSGKRIEVRSIQLQDEDQKEAGPGSRVGLCFKGSNPEEIKRGQVLTIEPLRSVTELECEVKASKFAADSKHLHAFVGLQSVACEVDGLKAGGTARAIIRFKQPIAFDKEAIALCDLNKVMPRVVGVAREA